MSKRKKIKAFTPEKKLKMIARLRKGDSVYSIAKDLDLTPSVARYHADRIRGKHPIAVTINHSPAASNEVSSELVKRAEKLERERDSVKEDYENMACAKSELEEEVSNLRAQLREALLDNGKLEAKIEVLKELIKP